MVPEHRAIQGMKRTDLAQVRDSDTLAHIQLAGRQSTCKSRLAERRASLASNDEGRGNITPLSLTLTLDRWKSGRESR